MRATLPALRCALRRRLLHSHTLACTSSAAPAGFVSKSVIDLTNPATLEYLRTNTREHPALRACRDATASLSGSQMQTPPEQGALLALLCELLGAKCVLEVGTYTGYSAAAMALSLPPGGSLVTCDINAETMAVARRTFEAAGVDRVVQPRLGPALDTLDQLLAAGQAGQFDLAYIDADKRGYSAYFERCLRLVRVGGLLCVDNTLWYGKVADAAVGDKQTVALREFNTAVLRDERVTHAMLPIGDGLTLLRRRV